MAVGGTVSASGAHGGRREASLPAVQAVYAIARDGLVKIGFTTNISRRLDEVGGVLCCWYPSAVGAWLESVAHKHFAARCVGGEWFALTADDQENLPALLRSWEASAPPLTLLCPVCRLRNCGDVRRCARPAVVGFEADSDANYLRQWAVRAWRALGIV